MLFLSGEKLIEIKDNLTNMFQDVVDLAGRTYDKSDKAQLCINHGELREEIFIHLQDLSNLTGESIMDRVSKVLNSNQNLAVDDSLEIHVGLMRLTKGGGPGRNPPNSRPANQNRRRPRSGRALPLLPHLDDTSYSSLFNKKSIVEIVCEPDEFLCAAKGLVVCAAKLNGVRRSEFENLTRKSRQSGNGARSLKSRAENLQRQTGLPLDTPLRVDQLALFEPILNAKICVIQFGNFSSKPCITQCSDREDDRVLFLYHNNNHFHAVVNPKAMFPKMLICLHCFETYSPLQKDHPCLPTPCFVCKNVECREDKSIRCTDCNFVCRSQSCYDRHKEGRKRAVEGRSLCESRHRCKKCKKVVDLRIQPLSEHKCGQYRCKCCNEFVDQDHLCYLRRRGMKCTSGKFIFFDCETMQESVYQCDAGYTPPLVNDSCEECSQEAKCSKCKRCTACKTSNCGRNVHQVNLIVSQSVCDLCKDQPLKAGAKCGSCGDLCRDCLTIGNRDEGTDNNCCTDPTCALREKVFSGFDATYQFCSWLLTPRHKSFHCLAHNGRGFDFSFILNYCVTEARITPDCIFAGSKLMSMVIGDGLDIHFIDSLSFMAMPLKKLPKAFGLKPESEISDCNVTELCKGDFPHKFNCRQHQTYRGPYPDLSFYCIDSMNTAEREKFKEWYSAQDGKIFDFQKEILDYCRLDVSILRLACVRFRQIFMDITTVTDDDGTVLGYVDCFAHITIASACMQVFRLNFIEEYYDVDTGNEQARATFKSGKWWMHGERVDPEVIISSKFVSSNLPQIPAQGYVRNTNHSSKSIGWLEWESSKIGREIRHARNKGEKVIISGERRFYADGYDEKTGMVYEFQGCRYHGCPNCYPNRKVRDPRTGFTMEDLHQMTVKRTGELRRAGHRVKEMYECQFDKELKSNDEMSNFVKALDIPPRMKLRDCFYGGRTSVFTMYHECQENEEIHYADVCSLYPYINKTSRSPLGHPEIITSDFDTTLESYFGIVHCRVLPPRQEYVPVLPVRMGGKLTFPLCRTCAASENQADCTHSDNERAITGCWCSPEVMAALDQGYKIDTIYEVYHYPESTQFDLETKTGGLFSEQVNTFIKIKTEASGWPDWVESEDDKCSYLNQFLDKVGVALDKDNICVNPALRSIAKICLNSFWGKLGQRSNKLKTKFMTSTVELEKLQHNSQHLMQRIHIVNEDVLVVEYENKMDFEEESLVTNEVLAAFTTCFARLELLRHIKSVGQRILYCDTDSIFFVTKKVKDAQGNEYYDVYPQLGDSLGELTNELPPNVHITRFASTAPKSYAYKCNDGSEVTKFKGVTLNFQNSAKVNFDAVRDLVFGDLKDITLNPQTQFVRSKFDGMIFNSDLVKTVKCTFNKRRILDNFDTVPFGYVSD